VCRPQQRTNTSSWRGDSPYHTVDTHHAAQQSRTQFKAFPAMLPLRSIRDCQIQIDAAATCMVTWLHASSAALVTMQHGAPCTVSSWNVVAASLQDQPLSSCRSSGHLMMQWNVLFVWNMFRGVALFGGMNRMYIRWHGSLREVCTFSGEPDMKCPTRHSRVDSRHAPPAIVPHAFTHPSHSSLRFKAGHNTTWSSPHKKPRARQPARTLRCMQVALDLLRATGR
jgi:hypothetical protein